jgi:hypothetical protein
VNISSVNRNIGATRPRNSTVQLPRNFFFFFLSSGTDVGSFVISQHSSDISPASVSNKKYISILFIPYTNLYGRGVGFHIYILVAVERVSPPPPVSSSFSCMKKKKKIKRGIVSGAVGDISVGKQQLTKCTPPIHLIYTTTPVCFSFLYITSRENCAKPAQKNLEKK